MVIHSKGSALYGLRREGCENRGKKYVAVRRRGRLARRTKGPCKSSTSVSPAVPAPERRACTLAGSCRVIFQLQRLFVFPERDGNGSVDSHNTVENRASVFLASSKRGKATHRFEVVALPSVRSNSAWSHGEKKRCLRRRRGNGTTGAHLLIVGRTRIYIRTVACRTTFISLFLFFIICAAGLRRPFENSLV